MKLVAHDLACVRGGRAVFSGLGFAVAAGEGLAVTGPNGVGKSSLLRLVAGLVAPAGGRIALEGGDPDRTLPEDVHYLGHRDPVKAALSVAENLAFWTAMLGGGGRLDTQAALAAVGLGALADLPSAYLSAGQRRRLSLARLLTVHRPVWLLDEPTAALDAAGQAAFAGLVRDHLAGGGLALAATHMDLGVSLRELRLGSTP